MKTGIFVTDEIEYWKGSLTIWDLRRRIENLTHEIRIRKH